MSASDNPYAADFLERHLLEFACYLVEPILSVILLFLLLASKYRHTSRWVRSVFLVFVIILPIQSALGFLLLLYSEHFSGHTREYLFQWKSQLNGIAIGLLISLFLSPRVPERFPHFLIVSPQGCVRAQRSNQSMKPTAPPRNNFGVFATTPWIASRCPASLVRFASSRSPTPAVLLFNASRGL
ncbi:MAG: hypothetical protein DME55_05075 [Verrucomicrobia bacterium]|nr:MAG: hypothetical protein DME55_05075 [Verrucomicrobiota bacterium]